MGERAWYLSNLTVVVRSPATVTFDRHLPRLPLDDDLQAAERIDQQGR